MAGALPRGALSDAEAERLRFRRSMPVLPATYDTMVRLVGEERTIRFIRRYGGRDARIPERPPPDHPMVRILGRHAVQALRREYGVLKIKWPMAADYLAMLKARELRRRKGKTVLEIARALCRDPETIGKYVRDVAPAARAGAPEARPPAGGAGRGEGPGEAVAETAPRQLDLFRPGAPGRPDPGTRRRPG